jgi:hypothetical protein
LTIHNLFVGLRPEAPKAAEIFGLSFGQLGDQSLRTRPGKLQSAAIDDLQQQQRPEPR